MSTCLCYACTCMHVYVLEWKKKKYKTFYLGKFEEGSLVFPEKIQTEHGLWIW